MDRRDGLHAACHGSCYLCATERQKAYIAARWCNVVKHDNSRTLPSHPERMITITISARVIEFETERALQDDTLNAGVTRLQAAVE